MKQPKLTTDRLRNHFTYSWWSYLLIAVLLVLGWSLIYQWTEYVPPAERSLYVNFVGGYVPDDMIEDLTQSSYEHFGEDVEYIEFYGLTMDSSDSETAYYAAQKLQVMVAAGEGDVFLIDRAFFSSYASMEAFQPLDDLVAEGGPLYGLFTDEEIARGTFQLEGQDQPHLYGLPCGRLYKCYEYGVDPTGLFLTVTSYTANPDNAIRMAEYLAKWGLDAERPAWLDEATQVEDVAQQEAAQIAPIG